MSAGHEAAIFSSSMIFRLMFDSDATRARTSGRRRCARTFQAYARARDTLLAATMPAQARLQRP